LQERRRSGVPLETLNLVFPAGCEEEARYVEKKRKRFGMRAVRVGVAS